MGTVNNATAMKIYRAAISILEDRQANLDIEEELLEAKILNLLKVNNTTMLRLVHTMPIPFLVETHVENLTNIVQGIYSDNQDNWGRIVAFFTFVLLYLKIRLPMEPLTSELILKSMANFVSEYREQWFKEQGGVKGGLKKKYPLHYAYICIKRTLHRLVYGPPSHKPYTCKYGPQSIKPKACK